MAESISTLVDERVRALIPFIKKEVNEDVENLQDIEDKLVHQNFTCKICTVHPIIGIRYECPKCEDFSICQKCESLYDHDHNLMKIKKLEEKSPAKKVQPSLKNLYDIFFVEQIKEAEPKKENKEAREATETFERYAGPLKQIFGGKLADYRKLTNDNKLKLNGLVAIYCEMNNLSQQEGHNKLVDFMSMKLSKKFKKEPVEFKEMVEEHINLDYAEIEKIIAKTIKNQEKVKK